MTDDLTAFLADEFGEDPADIEAAAEAFDIEDPEDAEVRHD